MRDISIKKPIRLIELFAGYGSQAMALRNIGADFERYRVVEFENNVLNSYNAIHGTSFPMIDIRDVSGDNLGIAEKEKFTYIMTYSFPCTDLSLSGKVAGMKKGSGTRSGLLWEVERLMKETENLPDVLMMENVPQVASKRNIEDFNDWIQFLESKGYTNYIKVLNAKDFGIPQNRRRCFVVSILDGSEYKFPSGIPLKRSAKEYLDNNADERFYIDTARLRNMGFITQENQGTILIRQATKRGHIECDSEGIADLSYPTSKTRRGRVIENGNVCPTIMTSNHELCVVYSADQIRRLMPKECGKLMGVEDKDIEIMSRINSETQLYKQFGNSIVVKCLEAVFRNLNIEGVKTWEDVVKEGG